MVYSTKFIGFLKCMFYDFPHQIDDLSREVGKLKDALNSLSQLSYSSGSPSKRQQQHQQLTQQIETMQQQIKQLQYQLAVRFGQHVVEMEHAITILKVV